MSLKQPTIMLAVVTLCAAAGSAPALAQSESCVAQYNRVTALYQTAPLSPEYGQMAAAYSARCLVPPRPRPRLTTVAPPGTATTALPTTDTATAHLPTMDPATSRTSASTARCNEFDPPLVRPAAARPRLRPSSRANASPSPRSAGRL
jgi:hypothetical protein